MTPRPGLIRETFATAAFTAISIAIIFGVLSL